MTRAHSRAPDAGQEPASDDAELWRAFKLDGARQAREALFERHFPFARKIARRHFMDRRSGDIEFAELCQLAATGLLEALDGYDPAFGVPFRGYAKRRISGAILDGIGKMSEVREQISFRNRVRTERVRSLSTIDAETLPAADALEALVELAVGLAVGFILEDTDLYQTENTASKVSNAYESLAWKQTAGRMLREIDKLPDREQSVVRRHYIIGLTFEAIAALMGLTKGRISQIHRAALSMLRKRLLNARDFRLEG